ncbi:hypothetical protein Saro_1575 [Novosphingobium aromaticivorans DSM 12444]|uniref:Response regulator receiver domain protein (CheY-like) n=1 Tax=Novosphingobium aromaticivorans (strain ATCC 700278 / DSM 12444 / CCUG 56034 / CIP 105152 / NBRC 16084 / F199) TaxID=279238 RepID=Q2G808_NOVAD|nr:hypothetical protein [Novosphingobium aromaticivorans]ABD26015.1 hypothetical protein Saro_1575 [Novosphingobium aromaticivorans DSM 12444]SCY61493.1 hypothetical protein SAMN05660666_02257 [Novosphingobium aromaticivorans]
MAPYDTIALFVSDPAVLASLQFALTVEGFEPIVEATEPGARAVVIDRGNLAEGLKLLDEMRGSGNQAAAFILATCPPPRLTATAAAMGATLIEKPLRGDELARALRTGLQTEKVA